MNKRALVLTVLVLLLTCIGSAQSHPIKKEMLVGTWKLVSWSNVTDKGVINKEAFGRTPSGFLTYTSDGRMSAILTAGGRKPLTTGWALAPTEEKAAAFVTSYAYAGTFTVKGDQVIHHVEACTVQNVVGTDYVRLITELQSDRVTLRTLEPVLWTDGVRYAYMELVWERIK